MFDKSCLTTLTIGYAGKVQVKVKDRQKNKILNTYTNHNAGGDALFNFLACCLAGEYALADGSRPFKIKLFYNDNIASRGEAADPVTDEIHAVSSFVSINTAPDVFGNSVTFHFMIPYAYISGEVVNQICLYGADEKNNANYSAYFYILGDNKQSNGITVTRAMSNLSLMID